jgi:hypothetical protein
VFKPDYAPPEYQPTWRERINPRMIGVVVVGMLIVGLIGSMFFTWAQQVVTGGIVNHGDYSELNLKSMSLFEMDQKNGRDEDIPSKWRAMDGKKVVLIGEVWQPDSVGPQGAHNFQLCYSIANCCFGGPKKLQHFVMASVPTDHDGVQAITGASARVEGILHVGIQRDPELGTPISVYRLDVTSVAPVG